MRKGIKILLKILLKEQIYAKIASIKNKSNRFIDNMLLQIINLLPDRILLYFKSKLQIIRKMDYKESDIYLNIDSKFEYEQRVQSCKNEPEIVDWIKTFEMGSVFYDIGANVGAYSLVASKYFNGNIKVYSFEPSYINFAQLCRNIQLNNSSDSVIPLQIALSNRTTVDFFNYSSLESGIASHAFGDPIDYIGNAFKPVFKQVVMAYTIDDLIEQFRLPFPNYVKVDVDGIEYKILLGAKTILNNSSVKSIYIELVEESENANKIIDFLHKQGFRLCNHNKSVSHTSNYIFQKN